MSDIDLKQLRDRALAAPTGDNARCTCSPDTDYEQCAHTRDVRNRAAYIAALSPYVALQLLTRLERAERERDEARALKVPPTVDELLLAQMAAATARAQRDAAVAERDEAIKYRDSYFQNWKIAESNKEVARQDVRDEIAVLLEREADGWIDEDGKVAIRAMSQLVRAYKRGPA